MRHLFALAKESFLDGYAATMPRTPLRYAIEHLELTERRHYMELRQRRSDP